MAAETLQDMPQTGQRTVKRARVLLAARMRVALGEIDVRLRDLSEKGALIECQEPVHVGDEVVFIRGDTVVPARVAWTAGSRVGLEFLRMIDESEVLVHVARKPVQQNQQRFRRPRVLTPDMSEQERKLARLWGMSVGISVTAD